MGAEIHQAIREENTEKVSQLLADNAALVYERDNDGNTPLHIAAAQGNDQLIPLLLDYGASKDATNEAGITPLDTAKRWGKSEAVQLLIGEDEAGLSDQNSTAKAGNGKDRTIPELIVGTNVIRNAEFRRVFGTNALLKVNGALITVPLAALPESLRTSVSETAISNPAPIDVPVEKIHSMSVKEIVKVFSRNGYYWTYENDHYGESETFAYLRRIRDVHSFKKLSTGAEITMTMRDGRVSSIDVNCSPRGSAFNSVVDLIASNFLDLTPKEVVQIKQKALEVSRLAVVESIRAKRRQRSVIDDPPAFTDENMVKMFSLRGREINIYAMGNPGTINLKLEHLSMTISLPE